MNIAFLTPEFITEKNFDGGLSNYLARVSESLVKNGHEVFVFTLSHVDECIEYHGVHVVRIKRMVRYSELLPLFPFFLFKNTLYNIGYALRVRRVFNRYHKKFNFDVIQNASYCWLGLFLTLTKNVPIVTRVSSITRLWREANNEIANIDNLLFEFFEILMLKRSTAVYGPSSFLLNILNKEYGVKANLILPPFSVQEDELTRGESLNKYSLKRKRYALFFGTISRLKGVDMILKHIQRILKDCNLDTLVIIGKDNMKINHFLKENNLNSYIKNGKLILIPPLHHDELMPIIHKAQFVIIPSVIDNLPNTGLEALAYGKIVLTSSQSGMDQLVMDGVNGFIFNCVIDFKKKLKQIGSMTKSEQREMSTKAVESIYKLSPKITLSALECFYTSLISERNR